MLKRCNDALSSELALIGKFLGSKGHHQKTLSFLYQVKSVEKQYRIDQSLSPVGRPIGPNNPS
jgi:hypothetical protein